MVEALDESSALADAHGRHQWRRELLDEFEGFELPEYPTRHQEFYEVVRYCCTLEDGLEKLLDVTRAVVPALSHRLRPLLDEWHAVDLYTSGDWEALRGVLDFPLPELNAVVAELTADRVRLPSHCTTVWHAFVHLACRNTAPGCPPPSMALLERLAVRPDAAAAVGEIRAWNDRFAELWGLSQMEIAGLRASGADSVPSAGRETSVAGGSAPDPSALPDPWAVGGATLAEAGADDVRPGHERPVIRLFIKVAPDLTPTDARARRQGRREARYRISACVKYAESAALHQEAESESEGGAHELVPRNRLPLAVAELLTRMAQLWQARAENVVLEFFLPSELLNEPVEWWNRDPQLGYDNPLLSKYPQIVLHSLERVQRRDLHHAWRMRWARWKSHPDQGDLHWCDPDGRPADEHLGLLDAKIGKAEEVVGMVLSEPPRGRGGLGLREVRLGLDFGLPILIFHREDSASEEFRSMVREVLADDGLANLPARAQQWKSDSAAAGGIGPRDAAVIKHLNVIWDDPEQLLDGGPCAPATFVGGID
ncbi:VMAP-C domain-containing protein [Streptomyces sp. H27-D2]|uniref:VMAP-C domain-containing protein n=1 Tax=Streptomyces sp. H27-D2 TaxID=3046304 RepID=UPI002DBF11BC|nr:hypothetical protein [Streptomyces sp. H27-D2]MEC4018358.1 hypothetical protein [Streptomyces sp. H27-D2]